MFKDRAAKLYVQNRYILKAEEWVMAYDPYYFVFVAFSCSLLLEKEMATHFSVLAWRIRGTGEPGRLQSMGSHRVGHD